MAILIYDNRKGEIWRLVPSSSDSNSQMKGQLIWDKHKEEIENINVYLGFLRSEINYFSMREAKDKSNIPLNLLESVKHSLIRHILDDSNKLFNILVKVSKPETNSDEIAYYLESVDSSLKLFRKLLELLKDIHIYLSEACLEGC